MSFPKLGNKQHASDGTALLKPDDERSDRPSQARRQSTVQFGGTAAVTVSPGGVKGESKPPAHLQIKPILSQPYVLPYPRLPSLIRAPVFWQDSPNRSVRSSLRLLRLIRWPYA